ncbi:iron chelate uptake ABC transporter family permease subunit [Actinomycetospora lemnae]|uniref:Iron chelate uptake ABC transporter family permease subunit n=1 Tax=Actinomycetospora lemnae TaxID=3019891 RepID=A0ABT5T376_9PSEU|nr:iron chelate uptake ABC transporter family permease subunit [Actinomycetospora sp. DW7H6]MDD7969426.1 iron chelate uptake ABC transporter family permease subunit [Actinomycetospora sp. DW7H6]
MDAPLAQGGPTPVTPALAGLAVSELLLALTAAMVLGDGPSLDAHRFWAAGALDDRGSTLTLQVLPFVLAGTVLAFADVRALDVLALGEDSARTRAGRGAGTGRRAGRGHSAPGRRWRSPGRSGSWASSPRTSCARWSARRTGG